MGDFIVNGGSAHWQTEGPPMLFPLQHVLGMLYPDPLPHVVAVVGQLMQLKLPPSTTNPYISLGHVQESKPTPPMVNDMLL